jgi:hypothetical protein
MAIDARKIAFALAVSLFPGSQAVFGQTATEAELLNRIRDLESRLAAVEARLAAAEPAQPQPAAEAQPSKPVDHSAAGDTPSPPGFAAGTTVNLLLDGYYEYNFNHPADRVNLLRPFDPSSNSFTLNQGAIVVERSPDPEQGRRFGMRLDLMFGQATGSLSGNPANEPRTAPYRNIYQAYGSYVLPLGKGLNVDFGRFASPIGMESAFAKDQINYTRSLLFAALPFYHMGIRAAYRINNSTTATWMLVNGANQTEDFNGFKSNHFMLSKSFGTSLAWTVGYYVGREGRDASPKPDGRTHIADTYLAWSATPKLTLAGEGDYVVRRVYANSPPSRLSGGAVYAKYQLVPAFYVAGRYEYVSDRGGYLSGATQAIKEATLTASYQPANGFEVRWEFRHDYSNQPFYLTGTNGILRKDQNTALLAFLWWLGGKQGQW